MIVATDGGWRRGIAGIAWFGDSEHFGVTSLPCTSSARAEAEAVVMALEANRTDLVIRTDFSGFGGSGSSFLRFLRRQHWDDLLERTIPTLTDRRVRIEQVVSKGPKAVPEVQVCDLLERYARRMFVISGATFTLAPSDLTFGTTGELLERATTALEHLPVRGSRAGALVRELDPIPR